MVRIDVANELTDELVSAVHRLLPHLSSSASLPSGAEIEQIVLSGATTLFVARDKNEQVPSAGEGRDHCPDGPIVGLLTLVTFRIPTGIRAWVEDVVVDPAAEGRGIGTALVKACLDLARAKGAQTVDLTSRPSREAANRLYQKVGFELRQTNVYRYRLEG